MTLNIIWYNYKLVVKLKVVTNRIDETGRPRSILRVEGHGRKSETSIMSPSF